MTYDFVGLGHLIKDELYEVSDADLLYLNLNKGQCHQVSLETLRKVQSGLLPGRSCLAGSITNSLSLLSGLGARCYLAQSVQNEELSIG